MSARGEFGRPQCKGDSFPANQRLLIVGASLLGRVAGWGPLTKYFGRVQNVPPTATTHTIRSFPSSSKVSLCIKTVRAYVGRRVVCLSLFSRGWGSSACFCIICVTDDLRDERVFPVLLAFSCGGSGEGVLTTEAQRREHGIENHGFTASIWRGLGRKSRPKRLDTCTE